MKQINNYKFKIFKANLKKEKKSYWNLKDNKNWLIIIDKNNDTNFNELYKKKTNIKSIKKTSKKNRKKKSKKTSKKT